MTLGTHSVLFCFVGSQLARVRGWQPWRLLCCQGWTRAGGMGHLDGWLRSEQSRLLCSCRHARAAPRHSPASNRVSACSQATQPTQDRLLHAVRHRRQRGASSSTAGAAGRSRLCFPPLWHAAVSSVHSWERLRHDAAAPTDRTVSGLCATGRMPCLGPLAQRCLRWVHTQTCGLVVLSV